jgi:hypothetical protein
MPDQGEQANVYHTESGGNVGKWILLALAVIYVAGSLFFGYDMHNKVAKLTDDQTASQQQIAGLTKRMQSAEADAEALGEKSASPRKKWPRAPRSCNTCNRQRARASPRRPSRRRKILARFQEK